jgi:Rrf2 family protein
MILTRAGEYAIRVALHLACERERRYVPIHELAERSDAPYHFLAKICQRLTQAGILESCKGPNGGIALVPAPTDVTLLEVVEALGALDGFGGCVLGMMSCGDESPCPLHDQWAQIKQRIQAMLGGKSLAALAEDLSSGRVSITQRISIG